MRKRYKKTTAPYHGLIFKEVKDRIPLEAGFEHDTSGRGRAVNEPSRCGRGLGSFILTSQNVELELGWQGSSQLITHLVKPAHYLYFNILHILTYKN